MGFISKDGRTVSKGQKVAVYRNLHNGLWSIQDASSGLVLGYCEHVTLQGLQASRNKRARKTFHVLESGREKVLKEKKKNVHAYIIGHLVSFEYVQLPTVVYYNPYKVKTFVSDDKAVYDASLISLNASSGLVTAEGVR